MTRTNAPPCTPGLYEDLIDHALEGALSFLPATTVGVGGLEPSRSADLLAGWLARKVRSALETVPDEERPGAQIRIVNRLLTVLGQEASGLDLDVGEALVEPGSLLLHLVPANTSGLQGVAPPARPRIPLRESALLVNGPHDLSIGVAVSGEMESADAVDLLCAFVRWSGLRVVEKPVREFIERGRVLRVITTVYTGATERRALDRLVDLGAQVKISHNLDRTRLHAKAWMFRRHSGHSTAYIGSSNLSHAALLDGMEWNVRLSNSDNPGILHRFSDTFEQYWRDPEFHPYRREDGDLVDRLLSVARGQERGEPATDGWNLLLDVAPKPHQREILDALAAERQRGHFKNLVVAATGTGKTWVAAFDYQRLCEETGRTPRLLFVAHREEILRQSRQVFQIVTRRGDFGELLVGGLRPEGGHHVFAAIQSLHADRLSGISPDFYEVLVVDEFHHAMADTYDRLLRHLKPRILLGLTATPERADGRSVLEWFDGRIAAEIRLWGALDQGLLCPFQYFGVNDGTDLSSLDWHRGHYDLGALERLYTGHHERARRILLEVGEKVSDPSKMRALGFCVGVDHARFMAARFEEAGLRALAIHGETPASERRDALERLRRGEIRAIFAVDLFNEGVDLPEVDTVLFLRPTESATVFLQQLGRGLRSVPGKSCLTVLDFIGNAHRRFRFDVRYRAIVGGTRRSLVEQIELGFPLLPPGCSLSLDRIAQRIVLDNIRQALQVGRRSMIEDLKGIGRDVDLAGFLREADIEAEDLYAQASERWTWTALRREARLPWPASVDGEEGWLRALARLVHIDDPLRLETWSSWLERDEAVQTTTLDAKGTRLAWMLFALLGDRKQPLGDVGAFFGQIWVQEAFRRELTELLAILLDRTRRIVRPLLENEDVPLRIHATYSLYEIISAFGLLSPEGRLRETREGVLWCEQHRCDLLFVTLQKSEKEYSPSTLYRDYPISQDHFHWESQSGTRAGSPTGQRYQTHESRGSRVFLFVRSRKRDDRGIAAPYLFLGPASYVSHLGERPMAITWRLHHPMPASVYQEAKLAEG